MNSESREWDEENETVAICFFRGVGCNLELHVQHNTIVNVTCPSDHRSRMGTSVINRRFGFQHVQILPSS